MKSLFAVLLLSGALSLAAGCGPQDAFCPSVGADAGGVCPIFGDDATAPVQDTGTGGNVCPTGQHLGDNPDGNPDGVLICVCSNGSAPPCQ
jgi:hypothetical protein